MISNTLVLSFLSPQKTPIFAHIKPYHPSSNIVMSGTMVSRTVRFLTGKDVYSQNIPCSDDETQECLVLCDLDGCSDIGRINDLNNIKIGVYIALWFALSTAYNLENKVRLTMLPLPWFQSAFSLFVGTIFVSSLWTLKIRPLPIITRNVFYTLLPISFCHSIGHIGAVVSANSGAVSFTQIVKAAEPVFTCFLSALLLKKRLSKLTMLSLIPIVFGVALASVTELSFTWIAFGGAMLSNLAFAIRNICSRASMDKPKGENMTPENLFGVLTVMSFLFAFPLAILMEGQKIGSILTHSISISGLIPIVKSSVFTGLYFYTYNEVAMLALNNVHPVTHAVANTMKRIVILLASVIFFQTPMKPLCMIGSFIAILGGYMYSLAKSSEKVSPKNK